MYLLYICVYGTVKEGGLIHGSRCNFHFSLFCSQYSPFLVVHIQWIFYILRNLNPTIWMLPSLLLCRFISLNPLEIFLFFSQVNVNCIRTSN